MLEADRKLTVKRARETASKTEGADKIKIKMAVPVVEQRKGESEKEIVVKKAPTSKETIASDGENTPGSAFSNSNLFSTKQRTSTHTFTDKLSQKLYAFRKRLQPLIYQNTFPLPAATVEEVSRLLGMLAKLKIKRKESLHETKLDQVLHLFVDSCQKQPSHFVLNCRDLQALCTDILATWSK